MTSTLALGTGTLYNITTATNVCAVGHYAGANIVTGTGNIYLGNKCGNDQGDESNTLRIGFSGNYIITGNMSTGALTTSGTQISLSSTTITSTPSGSRTYTIPDFGSAASFVMTNNTNTTMTTGTWAVTLGDGTNNFALNAGSTLASYSRIGDSVFFSVQLAWNNIGSASGIARLSLPFTVEATGNYRGFCSISFVQNVTWGAGTFAAGTTNGQNFVTFINLTSGGSPTGINCSAFSNTGGQFQVGGYFRTA